MCIWIHTITYILEKTPHNMFEGVHICDLQVLLLKDKNFPDPVDQHSWPLFSAQLPLLSIDQSQTWSYSCKYKVTNNKQKNNQTLDSSAFSPPRMIISTYLRYLHHSSRTLQNKFHSKFAFCWLKANSKPSKPKQILWVSNIWTRVNFLTSVVVLSHMQRNI